MKHRILISILAGCVLAIPSFGTSLAKERVISTGEKAVKVYFTARPDHRRCISPLCGGYWVSAVNGRTKSTCADGNLARECYVADLALPPGVTYEAGDLLHGVLGERFYSVVNTTLGVLRADFVYSPVLRADVVPSLGLSAKQGRGRYNLIHNTGIVCITTPCPSRVIRRLNSIKRRFFRRVVFHGSSNEETAALKQAFHAEYTLPENHGALVFGRFQKFRDKKLFKVKNVYTTKVPAAPGPGEQGGFCGGIAGIQCEGGLVCRLDGPYPDAGGICLLITL